MAKKALGKGLGALIKRPAGSAPQTAPSELVAEDGKEAVQNVALERVVPSPFQPRTEFRDGQLDELVASIREHGIIQPLIVRSVEGKLELIAGERRWRASQKLGLPDVPVIVREATDRDVLELALIENLQREDLNPVEEAEAYVRLSKEFELTQEDIAKRVGKNRATVANAMRLLDLDPEVRVLLAQGRLATGHAKVLLGAKDPEKQRLLADQVVRKGLTVRETEKLLSVGETGQVAGKKWGKPGAAPELTAAVADVTERLRERFATQVGIHHGKKKGKIEIEYYGNDDLDRILGLMGVDASGDF